jgi:hypothetical protein
VVQGSTHLSLNDPNHLNLKIIIGTAPKRPQIYTFRQTMTLVTSIARHSARKLSLLPRAMYSCQFSTSRLLSQNAIPTGQAQPLSDDVRPAASDSLKSEQQIRPKKRRRIVFEHEIDDRPDWLKTLSRQRDKVMAVYIKLVKKQPFVFYGGPFLTLIVIASYYLQEITEIRYKAHDQKQKMARYVF